MTQSRRSFSVGGGKPSMFNACITIFTDYHSYRRIVESLETNEPSNRANSPHNNRIHKVVSVVSHNKDDHVKELPDLVDVFNKNYDMNSDDFTIDSFPKMIDKCCAIYISCDDKYNLSYNTHLFMSNSFKKKYIKYLLHEFDELLVDKFIAKAI